MPLMTCVVEIRILYFTLRLPTKTPKSGVRSPHDQPSRSVTICTRFDGAASRAASPAQVADEPPAAETRRSPRGAPARPPETTSGVTCLTA